MKNYLIHTIPFLQIKRTFFLCLLFINISSINNLSREEAGALIENFPDFIALGQNPLLHEEGWNDGIEQGYWLSDRNITQKGSRYFYTIGFGNLTHKIH